MKLGLRPQLVVLLAALLSIAFSLVYFAISTYTEVALEREARRGAEQLAAVLATVGNTPSGVVNDIPAVWRVPPSVAAVLRSDAQLEVSTFGNPALLEALRAATMAATPGDAVSVKKITADGAAFYALQFPHGSQHAALLLAISPTQTHALHQLIALYLLLVAVSLLVAVYFAATRWVISPIDQLSHAAEKVAAPQRAWLLPAFRSSEFADLANSLSAMTERLLAEERSLRDKIGELELAREQLNTAQTQLIRSERLASVGQLAAGIAHEVGNPLAAIQGLLDLLLDGDLEVEQQRDFVRRVLRETERINRILRDLLQFARDPALAGSALRLPGNIEQAAQETVTLIEPQPSFRGMQMQISVEPELPLVALEHEHLIQVLLNLWLNAASACRGDGHITLHARRDGDGVQVTVEDNGPGIDKTLGARIFEPFVTSKEVGEGTGLGLSVCRGLIESSGGSIQFDAEFTAGARFIVYLPQASGEERG